MKKELLIAFGVVAIASFVWVLPAMAGNIEQAFFTVTPDVKYGDRVSNYKVSFVVASSTEVESRIRLIFPGGFGLPSTMATTSITSSAGGSEIIASATVSDSEVTIWLADGAVTPASDTIEIDVIPAIKNPAGGGSLTLGIETRTLANDLSDQGSSTAFTIIAGATDAKTPDTTPPVSTIDRPTSGANIAAGNDYVISGTGRDAGGSAIETLEVSVDGGKTWLGGQVSSSGGTYNWEYRWKNPTAGEYTIQVRATDVKGNVESPSAGVKVTVAGDSVLPTPTPTPTPAPAPTPTPTPPPVVEKPIGEMTASELQAKITSLQQQLISLLTQLVQLLTAQLY